jgi:hypothetical protein
MTSFWIWSVIAHVYVNNLTPEGRMVSVGALGTDTMAYKESEAEERVFGFMV